MEVVNRLLRSYSSRLVLLRREHADEMQRGRLRTVLVHETSSISIEAE